MRWLNPVTATQSAVLSINCQCAYNFRTNISVIFSSPCVLLLRRVSKISPTILLQNDFRKTRLHNFFSDFFVSQALKFDSVIICKPHALPLSRPTAIYWQAHSDNEQTGNRTTGLLPSTDKHTATMNRLVTELQA